MKTQKLVRGQLTRYTGKIGDRVVYYTSQTVHEPKAQMLLVWSLGGPWVVDAVYAKTFPIHAAGPGRRYWWIECERIDR